MSLDEKAKTGREICDSIMEFYKGLGMARLVGKRYISLEEFKRRELEEWVRLEDARQEIDKVEEAALKAYCSMGEQKVIEETTKKCYGIMLKTELERERGDGSGTAMR